MTGKLITLFIKKSYEGDLPFKVTYFNKTKGKNTKNFFTFLKTYLERNIFAQSRQS